MGAVPSPVGPIDASAAAASQAPSQEAGALPIGPSTTIPAAATVAAPSSMESVPSPAQASVSAPAPLSGVPSPTSPPDYGPYPAGLADELVDAYSDLSRDTLGLVGIDVPSPEDMSNPAPPPAPAALAPVDSAPAPISAVPSPSALGPISSAPGPLSPSGAPPEALASVPASASATNVVGQDVASPRIDEALDVAATVPAPVQASAPPAADPYLGEDAYGYGLASAESMPSDAEIAAMLGGDTIPSPEMQTATPERLDASIFGEPTTTSMMNPYSSGMPQPGEFSTGFTPHTVTPSAAVLSQEFSPAVNVPAPDAFSITTATGLPSPSDIPSPTVPGAPSAMPSSAAPAASTAPPASVPSPTAVNPMDTLGVPGAPAPTQPTYHGLTTPASKIDAKAAAVGGLVLGPAGLIAGPLGVRVAGSIMNTGPMSFGSVPSPSGSSGSALSSSPVSVTKVGSGLYQSSYGNVIDVSGDPADVMTQPGGAEALAAAGAESLADSGLHDSDGGISQEARDAIDSGTTGGLF
jgi:hypothetical protein